ncbi:MAG: hypothetical protein J7623_05850 [Chitinophaga sp.]|uniref:hypothetical protein n=1 Tax=Chitinophaga sp. TaxID=1869181 RepID=UPI001B10C70F|nr:hypothetical protein [Chitinophaga sp.]MBO9728144.1 hypothetical protein [Chitinophaga sp.]
MKFTFLASVSLLFAATSFSQTYSNKLETSGNVGIGTTAPTSKLHIAISSLLDSSAIRIGFAGDPGKLAVPVGGVPGGYNIDFHTYRDNTPNQIGARIRAERINRYAPDNALIQGMDLVFSTSTGLLATDLTERMRINNMGSVGIGLATPACRLHVSAPQATALSFAKFSQENIPISDACLSIVNATNATGAYIPAIVGRGYSAGRPFGIMLNGESDDIVPASGDEYAAAVVLDGRSKGNTPLTKNNVLAVNSYGQNLLLLKANGSLGIGTTDTKGYKLAVNGSGIFTRIKVKDFANWPDYVFHAGYELPSLAELEQYVQTHQHLPGIPAAEEVKKDGVDLGEMNSKLLQKVEELTLYIIELNKKVEALQVENKQRSK